MHVIKRENPLQDVAGSPNRRNQFPLDLADLAAIDSGIAEFLLNTEELVVFSDTVRTTERTCFDLPAVRGYSDICNGCVLCFA